MGVGTHWDKHAGKYFAFGVAAILGGISYLAYWLQSQAGEDALRDTDPTPGDGPLEPGVPPDVLPDVLPGPLPGMPGGPVRGPDVDTSSFSDFSISTDDMVSEGSSAVFSDASIALLVLGALATAMAVYMGASYFKGPTSSPSLLSKSENDSQVSSPLHKGGRHAHP